MNRRVLLALAVAAAGVLVVGTIAVLAPADGGGGPSAAARAVHLERCDGLHEDDVRDCFSREFLAIVKAGDDPRAGVETITKAVRSNGGFVLANCHVIMHAVGRAYAADAGVTLATLMDNLPKDNDPGCPAGFAHGLVTGVAPDIDPNKPRAALAVCAQAATRFQRYSCVHGFGHAFMRIYEDRLDLALPLCRSLGSQAAPDCAQGAYHDYWFAVLGADDATRPENVVTNPRELCAAQPAAFVRPCWYRAFLEQRPGGFALESPRDLESLCEGLDGLQRGGCITAASLIGPPDPAAQLDICAHLKDPSDAANCARATKVQNVLGARTAKYVTLIERCGRFAAAARAACFQWLGKALNVLTDGGFEADGCPRLRSAAARRECVAGARTMQQALVTFS